MRQAAADYAGLGITEIARTLCEWLDWKRPNGRLKNHECRLLLERLGQQGLLTLPALRRSGRRGPRTVTPDAQSDPQTPIQGRLADLQPLRMSLIDHFHSALWRQYLQRYHYLGCRVPVGAHLRYFVYSAQGQILACLLWSSPAWKMAARDHWIGWTPDQRTRNLQFIVNNSRFLILPWVQVKNLAPDPGPLRPPDSPPLVSPLWLHAAVTGDPRRCHSLQRHLLSRRQLDCFRTNYRPRPNRYSPLSTRNTKTDICFSTASTRSAATLRHRFHQSLPQRCRITR